MAHRALPLRQSKGLVAFGRGEPIELLIAELTAQCGREQLRVPLGDLAKLKPGVTSRSTRAPAASNASTARVRTAST